MVRSAATPRVSNHEATGCAIMIPPKWNSRWESPLPKGRVSAARSRNMAAIKGRDTKPEMFVRRALHAAGFRFRLHRRDLPGRPDIVLPKYRTVIFVHGCFWHHHSCDLFVWPKTRAAFWRKKIDTNQDRDRQARRHLIRTGWKVFILWECAITADRLRTISSRIRAQVEDDTAQRN